MSLKLVLESVNNIAGTITILGVVLSAIFRRLSYWFVKNKNNSILNVMVPIFLMIIPILILLSFFYLKLEVTHKTIIIIGANIGLLYLLYLAAFVECDKFNARRLVKAKYGLFEFDHTELPSRQSKEKLR